ncbi:AI-2E family transporter [Paracoccus sp. (in: a-proteobacteria)]|uniref:AI-2E family transporter n=1 Tax=Paracoccus sp. TaxID=267 RepID=UPI0026DF3046|nr:AI-2E family transporter [Paracoccus sp. (in: a-proteobacteria)]MDO5370152.1 AI-2E family transporter [Paracoccus sp. (in: a-proteobacteria)]
MAQTSPQRHMFPRRKAEPRGHLPVTNWAVIGIFIILAFQMLATARAFLMPVCLGVLLFFVFVPFRRWMDRRGIRPGVTAGIVVLGILATIGTLGFFISGPAGALIEEAPGISRQLQERYETFRENFRGIERAAENLSGNSAAVVTVPPGAPGTVATVELPATPPGPAAALPNAARDGTIGQPLGQPPSQTIPSGLEVMAQDSGTIVASSTVTDGEAPTNELRVEVAAPASGSSITQIIFDLGPAIVSQTVFTLIFLFFLLASGDLLYLRIVQSFDALSEKRAAYDALRQIEASLGSYLGAITLINLGLGVASGLAMWTWGMPSPLLWGIAAAVLNYIPYIGAALGYVAAALVALVVFDDGWTAVLVGLTYFGLTAFEGQFITPYFVSWRLQLNPVVVFLTVALWAWLWSVLGMVVAVPMLVVMRVLSDHIPALEKFGNFLAGEPPPALEEGKEGP